MPPVVIGVYLQLSDMLIANALKQVAQNIKSRMLLLGITKRPGHSNNVG